MGLHYLTLWCPLCVSRLINHPLPSTVTCSYGDYTTTPSGLQYFDLKEGSGKAPGSNSLCTVDWDGYTIGYYGERSHMLRAPCTMTAPLRCMCSHSVCPHIACHTVTC